MTSFSIRCSLLFIQSALLGCVCQIGEERPALGSQLCNVKDKSFSSLLPLTPSFAKWGAWRPFGQPHPAHPGSSSSFPQLNLLGQAWQPTHLWSWSLFIITIMSRIPTSSRASTHSMQGSDMSTGPLYLSASRPLQTQTPTGTSGARPMY